MNTCLPKYKPMKVRTCPLKPTTATLVRGFVGLALMAGALRIVSVIPFIAVLLGIGALIAFRGCPMCWLVSLVQALEKPAPTQSGDHL